MLEPAWAEHSGVRKLTIFPTPRARDTASTSRAICSLSVPCSRYRILIFVGEYLCPLYRRNSRRDALVQHERAREAPLRLLGAPGVGFEDEQHAGARGCRPLPVAADATAEMHAANVGGGDAVVEVAAHRRRRAVGRKQLVARRTEVSGAHAARSTAGVRARASPTQARVDDRGNVAAALHARQAHDIPRKYRVTPACRRARSATRRARHRHAERRKPVFVGRHAADIGSVHVCAGRGGGGARGGR